MTAHSSTMAIRVHLTNVAGLGAIRLLQSLLPGLEHNACLVVSDMYIPDRGELAAYRPASAKNTVRVWRYRRWLPNAISRLLECTVLGRQFGGDTPLLVLGDLPIRCHCRQVVFVQNSHLLTTDTFHWSIASFKFAISRWIFRANLHCVSAFIVQTPLMKAALQSSYPQIRVDIEVIAQPVPAWVINRQQRSSCPLTPDRGLRLVYPAAAYPHKNHRILSRIAATQVSVEWPVERLILTIAPSSNPAPDVSWVRCVGRLSEIQMLAAYAEADGLLFLSTDESYGFPLLEAMYLGLPIVCPDLPYARSMCGDQAIYFRSGDIRDLHHAVGLLHVRLSRGWLPDWSDVLRAFPRDWRAVADAFVRVVAGRVPESQPEAGAIGR